MCKATRDMNNYKQEYRVNRKSKKEQQDRARKSARDLAEEVTERGRHNIASKAFRQVVSPSEGLSIEEGDEVVNTVPVALERLKFKSEAEELRKISMQGMTNMKDSNARQMKQQALVEAARYKLPTYLRGGGVQSPKTGGGVHQWLYNTALQLHRHLDPVLVIALLRNGVTDCGRTVTSREINDAVSNSLRVYAQSNQLRSAASMWIPLAAEKQSEKQSWPKLDYVARHRALSENQVTLAQLRAGSPWPIQPEYGTDGFVHLLFPRDPLLCCGTAPHAFQTKSKKDWGSELDKWSFIVPSPMSALKGRTKSGRTSARSNNNTGPRKYLVVEFDSGSFDEQAGLICHLAKRLPLVMVVHSGNKSLHAWFIVVGRSAADVQVFFAHAVSLGADPATWTPSQMVRMPGGVRHLGHGSVFQEVMWFNLNAITTHE